MSVTPRGLTDGFWLAAYDTVDGKPWISQWSLRVGLAAGLLVELVCEGYVELRDGELFRTTGALPDDPALRPLLITMRSEEDAWSSSVSAQARGVVSVDEADEWAGLLAAGHRRQAADRGGAWSPQVDAVRGQVGHRRRGHELGAWLSYLAYEGRAEQRVVDRLSRAGLVRFERRRRFVGRARLCPVPCDSVTAGLPASVVSFAVHRGQALSWGQLVLAGLFLATGLHHHALSTLSPAELTYLGDELEHGLDDTCRELLHAADVAVGEAAMR